MDKKIVLFVLIDAYADWEASFAASALHRGLPPAYESPFVVKTVAKSHDEVISSGGFRVLPDYDIHDMPSDYAAIVLIGAVKWRDEASMIWKDVVLDARKRRKVIGAIGNGASFLSKLGLLNDVNHTGNGPEQLKSWDDDQYTNPLGFVERQAVSDDGVVTANTTAYLEFCRELLLSLHADTTETIRGIYHFAKSGYYSL